MAEVRTSQVIAEIARSLDVTDIKTSQIISEAAWQKITSNVMLSQFLVEIAYLVPSTRRYGPPAQEA